jgi:predicted lipoprotein with Yx(FWY)xxD motif
MSAITLSRPTTRLGLAFAAAGLLAAGCGGSSGGSTASVATTPTTSTTAAAAGAGTPVSLTTHEGPVGTYLTTGDGMSVYVFAKDTGSSSTCSGSCAVYWPPLTGGSAHTSGGATAAMTGTTKRSDGTTQITYGGHPLYTYVGDKKAGDTNGEGLNLSGGKWWLVGADGTPLTGSTSSGSSSSSSTSVGWS